MFLGLPDPDPLVRDPDLAPDPDSSFFSYRCERTEIMLANKILTQNFNTINFLRLKIMCLRVSYKEKI